MALPESSVSSACRSVAEYLRQKFRAVSGQTVQVLIGAPANAQPETGDTEHRVNLFFHRFEPAGFGPDASPGETWWLRVHCLVTAFSVEENLVSAGENDLRLLGEVIRFFHEKPVMDPVAVAGETMRAELVFQPLSLEDINRLWSTQKDVAYRPSVAYELALVPVVPEVPAIAPPRVGSVGQEVRATMGQGVVFTRSALPPPVPAGMVDTSREDWAPRSCFVVDGACAQSLTFEVGSSELAAFQAQVLVAGKPGSKVELRWQVWDAQSGWSDAGSPVSVTVSVPGIDPDAPGLPTLVLDLPFKSHAGQMLLYAVHTYQRAADGGGGPTLEARGNPLLITLFEGGA
jgi:Pvc16 N-terminal domain